jgi:hypothetical protein
MRKFYFVLLGFVIPSAAFVLPHLLDGWAHACALAVIQGEATLLKESMKAMASETARRPSHQWAIFLWPMIPFALVFLVVLVHYAAIYLRYIWTVLRALVILCLVPALAGFLSLFLVKSARTSCCGSSSPVKTGGRSVTRHRKREERAQLVAARADFRRLFQPTQEVVEQPSQARRRRQAEALELLESDEDQWRDGLLADISFIDEATVREDAENEIRGLYLTPQQRRRYPQHERRGR